MIKRRRPSLIFPMILLMQLVWLAATTSVDPEHFLDSAPVLAGVGRSRPVHMHVDLRRIKTRPRPAADDTGTPDRFERLLQGRPSASFHCSISPTVLLRRVDRSPR